MDLLWAPLTQIKILILKVHWSAKSSATSNNILPFWKYKPSGEGKLRITYDRLLKVMLDQQFHHWPWSVAVESGWTAAKGFTWYENASCHKSTKALFVVFTCLFTILNHE